MKTYYLPVKAMQYLGQKHELVCEGCKVGAANVTRPHVHISPQNHDYIAKLNLNDYIIQHTPYLYSVMSEELFNSTFVER